MRRSRWWIAGLLGLVFMTSSIRVERAAAARNPFGVRDVEDPVGQDIKEFAQGRRLPGGKNDRNASQWVTHETLGKPNSLEGEWSGRWEQGSGTAKIRVVNNRYYVLYTDHEGPLANYTWLLEAVKDGNHLFGRWVQISNPEDTGAYIGLIVDDERIDGAWISSVPGPATGEVFAPSLRWDFRRKLKK